MSHPPQASLSSSGRSDSSLPRPGTARFDERGDDLGAPRTRTSDGRSSEERVSEEQAFERAAAQLRPAWATGQARQYLSAASSSAPISGTTPLPPTSEAPASAPSSVGSSAAAASPKPAPALVASPTPVPSVIVSPSASSPSTVQSAAPTAEGALGRDGDSHDEIELSDAIYEGEPLLGPQPVYAASHSNFPAQPFDVGVSSSTEFRSRHITDETDDYSRAVGRFSLASLWARFDRPLNVKLLAMGAAACLAIGSVWALASGDSPSAVPPVGAVNASQPAAPVQAKAPVAPAPRAPAAAAATAATPAVPAELPSGRELPESLLPSRLSARAPEGALRPRDTTASTRPVGSVAASAVAKPTKAESKAAKARKTVASTTKKTPAKATTKALPAKGAPTKLGALPVAPKSKATPPVKAAKPQAKPAAKSRARSDVVDPWGR